MVTREPEQDNIAVLDAPKRAWARLGPRILLQGGGGQTEFVRPNSPLRCELTRQKARGAAAPSSSRTARGLHVEPEQDDIAVLDDVFLAFGTDQPLLPGGGHGAAGHEIVVSDHFRADKAALKVGVDLAGGLGCLSPLGDGPGPALVLAGGQVGAPARRSPPPAWRIRG